MKIKLYKAISLVVPVDDAEIVISEAIPDIQSDAVRSILFDHQATILEAALRSLPSGVRDRLLVKLLQYDIDTYMAGNNNYPVRHAKVDDDTSTSGEVLEMYVANALGKNVLINNLVVDDLGLLWVFTGEKIVLLTTLDDPESGYFCDSAKAGFEILKEGGYIGE